MKYYPHVIEMDRTQKCSTLPKKLPLCSFSDFQEGGKKASSGDSELFVQVCSMSASWDG